VARDARRALAQHKARQSPLSLLQCSVLKMLLGTHLRLSDTVLLNSVAVGQARAC
jgi:hypothetical protein